MHAIQSVGLVVAVWATLAPPARAQVQIEPTPVVTPNVLMIVLDDLGTEHLRAYQPSAVPPTPNLSALAAQGTTFTRFYAHPMCSISRAAWMTGRYPFRTGMGYIAEEFGYGYYTVPNSEVFLAEALRDGFTGSSLQYRRAAFGKWHLDGNNSQANMHPIQNGFERFYGHLTNPGSHFQWPLVDADASGSSTTPVGGTGVFDVTTWDATVIQDEATDWMNQQSAPFFAYVCFSPPHAPYEVPPFRMLSPATVAAIRALNYTSGHLFEENPSQPGYDANWVLCYDWMVEAVDKAVGWLVGGLTPEVRANTYVIVVGDNGTVSTLLPCDLQPGSPNITGHGKRTVYESGIRVPLLVTGPGVQAGATCDGLVSAVDVFPTVAELVGASLSPSAPPLDGVSFKQLIDAPTAPSARTLVYSQIYQHNGAYVPNPSVATPLKFNMRSLSDGEYKYIALWELDTLGPVLRWQQGFHVYDAAGQPLDLDEHCDLFASSSSTQTFPGCLTLTCPGGTAQDLARLNSLYAQMAQLSGL